MHPGFVWKRVLAQAALLVGVGVVLGVVNNLTAAETRQVPWIGQFPSHDRRPGHLRPGPGDAVTQPATTPEAEPAPARGPGPVSDDLDWRAAPPPAFDPGAPAIDVDGAQARALFEQGAVFVDARRTAVHAEGHVQGAISIPIWEPAVRDRRIGELVHAVRADFEHPIVVYCGGGACEDSHLLADHLHDAGYLNVLVYTGGYPDWSSRGWPTATGQP